MPDCIIPAGGRSSRMGFWKPELTWGDMTLIEKVASEALLAGCRVIVAGGYRFNDLKKLLELFHVDNKSIYLVFSRNWNKGMDETLRSALGEVKSERFFIVPSDMPLIVSDDYRRLSEISEEMETPMVLRPSFIGQPGHPVLIHKEISETLLTSQAGIPVRKVLEQYSTVSVPWDHEGVIRDLDTFCEYEKYKP